MENNQPMDRAPDPRERLDIRLEREQLFNLMLLAHERDITLNQLVEDILRARLELDYYPEVDG